MNNEEKAKEALKALTVLNEYLEEECVFQSETEWVDKKGYSFKTDIGYFWQGLEGLEECIIKRLRGAKPQYPKACEKYIEEE